MLEFVINNLNVILAGIVIPGLVFVICMAFRFGKGYYSSGLDAIAGLSGLDFGFIGLADVLRQALSRPFREPAELVFLALGLLGMLFFVLLLPTEKALSRYNAQRMASEEGYSLHAAGFPYFRVFFTWVLALGFLASNVLLFFLKAAA